MLTTRNDLIAHLAASDLGFAQVEGYGGQLRGLARDPEALTAIYPAAYVLAAGHTVTAGQKPRTLVHVLIAGQTDALGLEASAADALGRAEALTAFVRDHHDWTANGNRYINLIREGVDCETLAVTTSVSIVRVTWTVETR